MANQARGRTGLPRTSNVGAAGSVAALRTSRVGTGRLAVRADSFAGETHVDLGPSLELEPGLQIGQYELIREVGRGGMGVVYAARDLRLGRRVAMKFLREVEPEVIERFLTEARATAQCNHDNIVILYEVGEYAAMPYMVLEYLEGRTLRDVMEGFGDGVPIPPVRVVELMLPVARALVRAHELGIVHRDLKPENVMVTASGQVKVLDFGIAKALGGAAPRDSLPAIGAAADPTGDGSIIGTLPYMSPEQMGVDAIDHRSDLFAVGVILYEMLAGRHPIEPFDRETLFQHLVNPTPVRSIGDVVPDLPDGLVAIVDDCLRKAKQDRPADAAELVRRLRQLGPGARPLAVGECPYPGLSAFQEHDADRFFGRSRDVARMVARVRELPLTGIVGPSGIGKSSFARAGVGPALAAADDRWEVVTLRPGRHPLAALAAVIEPLAHRSGPVTVDHADARAALAARLRVEPGAFGVALRTRAIAADLRTLLFVDQFEELYTLVPDAGERRAFTAALAAVADDAEAPLRVMVSIRSDFLDRVAEDPSFLEELSRGLLFLSAPDRDGLREALELPVAMVGYQFEDPQIVDDMIDALVGTPGALPLLQFAAARLWDARDRDRHLLTLAGYQAIGGIRGALATHADEVIRSMTASARRLTQQVFRTLVTPERTRAIVELTELSHLGQQPAELARVIDQLVAARLLVVQTRTDAGGGSVELVHESLIDRWPTLRRWLDEEQEDAALLAQLGAAAKQWDSRGRPAGLLWRGDALEEARRWWALRPRTLPPRDQAFLTAVLTLGRRGRRLRALAVVATFIVLAAVAGGAIIAYVRVRAAEQVAQANARRADAENAEKTRALEEARAQERLARSAVADKDAAEVDRSRAEQAAEQSSAMLGMSREQLERKNAALEASNREARAAEDKAKAATLRAMEAAAEAERAKAALQVKLDAEKQRVRALEDETRKLTTKLKD